MSDNLTIINRVIEEHQTIRAYVKLAGDSTSDQEALMALTKMRPDWIPGQLDILTEKQNKLEQVLSSLQEGLRHHFDFEETALPPLLGELFMTALILDHQAIRKGISEAKAALAEATTEELSREELLSKESQIQQAVDNLCQQIEDHAGREEVILEMLQRALEEQEPDKG